MKKASKAAATEDEDSEVPPGQLGDWQDKVPADLQNAAQEMVDLTRQRNKKTAEFDSKIEDLNEQVKTLFREHGLNRCPIDEGKKFIEYSQTEKLAIKPAKKQDD